MYSEPVEQKLSVEAAAAAACSDPKMTVDEKTFRWMLNEDAMATEKLAEGIRNFTKGALADACSVWRGFWLIALCGHGQTLSNWRSSCARSLPRPPSREHTSPTRVRF